MTMLSKHARESRKVTRAGSEVWLVGATSESVIYNQLPTVRQILSRLFYLTSRPDDGATSRREQVRSVLQEVQLAWDKARIPTILPKSSIERIETIHDKWKALHKHASRGGHWPINPEKPSTAQVKNENAFIEKLDTLFDIADPQAIDKIEIEEDREFLIDQRGERKMFIGRIDLKQTRHEKKELKLQIARCNRLQKREEKRNAVKMKLEELRNKKTAVEPEPENEESDSASELDENANEIDPTIPPPRKRGRVSIATPELVASLDRTGTSDRKATVLLAAHLKALKEANVLTIDPEDIVLNRTSVRCTRIKGREEIAAQLNDDLRNAEGPFVLHWDGKLMPDIDGPKAEKVDRMAILVSGPDGFQRVLEIPKLKTGTGNATAEAVFRALVKYEITDKIGGICFDTTLTNTGKFKGAATLLEKLLGRRLVWLACRHHMFEIVLGGVFEYFCGHSKASTIKLFDHFEKSWNTLDKSSFSAGTADEKVYFDLEDDIQETLCFARHFLTLQQPRDDYREVLELLIIFLGGSIPDYQFKLPGPTSHARWMNKILYVYKICLFRRQYDMTSETERSLLELATFITREYVRAWFTAPLSTSAPLNDLRFLNRLIEYQEVHPEVSKEACRKFVNHLWYLSQDCIPFSLFDSELSHDEKDKIVSAMKREHLPRESARDACARVVHFDLNSVSNLNLHDFATKESLDFFTRLKMPTDFLELPSKSWAESKSYLAAKKIAVQLMVINDPAERGVCLMKTYNHILTKHEPTLQNIIKTVDKHRVTFKSCSKEVLLSNQLSL